MKGLNKMRHGLPKGTKLNRGLKDFLERRKEALKEKENKGRYFKEEAETYEVILLEESVFNPEAIITSGYVHVFEEEEVLIDIVEQEDIISEKELISEIVTAKPKKKRRSSKKKK